MSTNEHSGRGVDAVRRMISSPEEQKIDVEVLSSTNDHDATSRDEFDMQRLGRRQQLKRNFHAWSILGLASMTMISWTAVFSAMSFVFINGGRAASVYDYLAGWLGETLVVASLAEMASMAPTSAGQYHWVSEFAPPIVQKPMSYIAGWLAALTWQTYVATPAFAAAQTTLILASINNPSYIPQPWQETVLTLAVVLFVFVFNVYGAHALPATEAFVLVGLVVAFFATLVPLWALAPTVPASEVFGSFSNYGGWSSIGTACYLGQLTSVAALTGCDAAAHMAEEVKDASRTVPRMMMATILFSGLTGFVATITIAFIVQDVESQVVNSTAVYPFIGILQDAVGSTAGAIGMTVMFVPLNVFCSVSCMATASRQAWSFARDNGLPFPTWLIRLTTVNRVPLPVNAMIAAMGISVIIALLNLGGSEVFDSVYGLGSSAASTTYILGIGSILWRRLFGEPLPPARWSLGRWGVGINAISILFLVQYVVAAYFPLFSAVTPETMNWGIAMFGGASILSLVYYIFVARKRYEGPVLHLRSI